MTGVQVLCMVVSILAGWVFAHFQIVALLLRKGRSKALGHFVGAFFSWLGACSGLLISGGLIGIPDDERSGTRIVFCVLGLLILAPFAYVGRCPKATACTVPARAAVTEPTATPTDAAGASQRLQTSLQQHTDAVRQAMRSRSPAEREKIARAKTENSIKRPAIAAPLLPADLVFDYIDRGGTRTSRSVLSCRIDVSGSHHYITGFCEERRDERTFRFDRISGPLRVKNTGHFFSLDELVAINPGAGSVVFNSSFFRRS